MERIRIRWDEELRWLVDWLFVFFVYNVHVRIYVLFFLVYSVHNQCTWNRVCFVNYFYHKRTWQINYFSKKKMERIRICVLFVISYLFRQCHCHKQQIFFFTMDFFLFLFTTLQNKNIVLVLCVLFFCFCLHHFRIRILYLILQRVSCTWFFSLISAMPLPQLICHKFFLTNNN